MFKLVLIGFLALQLAFAYYRDPYYLIPIVFLAIMAYHYIKEAVSLIKFIDKVYGKQLKSLEEMFNKLFWRDVKFWLSFKVKEKPLMINNSRPNRKIYWRSSLDWQINQLKPNSNVKNSP